MSSFSAEVDGAAELANSLRGAADQLDHLTTLHEQEGNAALAVARIPRDSGYLDSTATVTATDAGFELSASAPYAGVVHAREPFFLRAIEARRGAIVQATAEHVADVLATVQGT